MKAKYLLLVAGLISLFMTNINADDANAKRLMFIEKIIEQPGEGSEDALHDDQENVLWVDWGEDDVSIVRLCEQILKSGSLSASLSEESSELLINYKNKSRAFPLIMTPEAQHITLLRLNEVLYPDYEIRMVWDSIHSDTLAMVPLPPTDWEELESRYGEHVLSKAFYKLSERPNVFTETLVRP